MPSRSGPPTQRKRIRVTKPEYRDAWVRWDQDPASYYTTKQLADVLTHDVRVMHPQAPRVPHTTVHTWCVRWFGPLPPERKGRGGTGYGYRVPLNYLPVARGWWQTEDVDIRRDMVNVIPKAWKSPYYVALGDKGQMCVSFTDVVAQAIDLLGPVTRQGIPLHVFYVGDPAEAATHTFNPQLLLL